MHSLTHALTHSFFHALAHPPNQHCTRSPSRPTTSVPIRTLAQSQAFALTCSFTNSRTRPSTHTLNQAFTNSLTRSAANVVARTRTCTTAIPFVLATATYSVARSRARAPASSLTRSITHTPNQSQAYSVARSLAHSPTHSMHRACVFVTSNSRARPCGRQFGNKRASVFASALAHSVTATFPIVTKRCTLRACATARVGRDARVRESLT